MQNKIKSNKGIFLIVIIATLAILILSCNYSGASIKTSFNQQKNEVTKVIKKGNANIVYATIKLIAGKLSIHDNLNNLMEGRFEFKNETQIPLVEYTESPEVGNLNIWFNKSDVDLSYDNDDEDSTNSEINWDISLNKNIPLDLKVKLGAGEGNFNLCNLNLQYLEISTGAGEFQINLRNSSVPRMEFKAGVGEATVDLSGKRHNNLNADFLCGIGELTILLPKDLGVKVELSGLAGSVNHIGFNKNEHEYTNDKFGKTKNYIFLKITGGLGEIDLKLVD